MKTHKLLISVLMLVAVAFTGAAHKGIEIPVSDLHIEKVSDYLNIDFTVNSDYIKLSKNEELTITPIVQGADSASRLRLSPIIIAGRNRRYAMERHGGLPEGAEVIPAGKSEPRRCHFSVEYEPWMERSEVMIDAALTGCCAKQETSIATPVAVLDLTPAVFSTEVKHATAKAETVKIRALTGQAFIDFPVNQTAIYPDYRRNQNELRKIRASVDTVRNDPDCVVTFLSFKGYASPEGNYSGNETLAKGRTRSLRDYVADYYDFPDSIISTAYEPEDWEGLRRYVDSSTIDNREEILGIIDSQLPPDRKDAEIKARYPKQYAFLLAEVYPGLRHSDYRIEYSVRQFYNPEEIKRIMAESPGKLSLSEFYIAADSCEEGSEEEYDIYETAVRMYPADTTANLNAALMAMRHSDYQRAQKYLDKAGDTPKAMYARGLLLAYQGDYEKAASWLEKSLNAGCTDARQALSDLKAVREKEDVKYLSPTNNHQPSTNN